MNVADQVTIVIPSLNPDEKLTETVDELLQAGFSDILIVNDGSRSDCMRFFPQNLPGCTILTHPINLGKGAAMKTAFQYFLNSGRSTAGVITVDGDGQHKASDVLSCAQKMIEKHCIVLGVRDFSAPNVPRKSRLGNRITSLVFRLFCGLKISDTQTGLRAIPANYLSQMLNIFGERYEYETNMLLQMNSWHIPYDEVPIQTVYLEDNRRSHFRPFFDSIRIYSLILKFISSSIAAAVVDLTVFFILSLCFSTAFGALSDAMFSIIARIISSLVNYFINRNTVFKSKASNLTSMLRYYILAAGILILSSAGISVISLLFHLAGEKYALLKTLIKFVMDSLLFLISFRGQREWVFRDSSADIRKE